MTVVAVRKYPDYIEMCADTEITQRGYGRMNGKNAGYVIKDFTKIIQENGMVCGSAGLVGEMLFLKEYMKTHLPKGNRIDDIESYFLDFYEERKSKDSSFTPYNMYILVYQGKIFCIQEYYVHEIGERDSIGSGMFYARTALYLKKSPFEACKIAIELSIGCGGKIHKVIIPLKKKK